jgi:transposase
MTIVGGLDIHRKQLTFDYLDTVSGEAGRGQVTPADRVHLRAWLARFAGRDDVGFALEGCTGWRYVAGELAAAGCAAHAGEPACTAAARGMPRPARPARRTCGGCWPMAACRSAGSRPAASGPAVQDPGGRPV